jgi:predicted enzyme related to lactoylglutathione lyase
VAAGGKVVAPKAAVPGIGRTANSLNGEGVLFGVMQNDAGAKEGSARRCGEHKH